MKRFNVIGGLPRSGSTLLSNILSEHPNIFVSDTSPVAVGTISAINQTVARPEYLSEIANDSEGTELRLARAARGFVSGWYGAKTEEIVFDKDRSNVWINNFDSFNRVFPNGKIVILARDPRDVFASVVSKRNKNPLAWGSGLEKRNLIAQAEKLFGPTGLVGSAIVSIENILQINQVTPDLTGHIIFIRYEELATAPDNTINTMYEIFGVERYNHDFNNIKKSATDRDELYGNYWPHEGHGRVEFKESPWKEVIPPGIAEHILNKYPLYSKYFGYIL